MADPRDREPDRGNAPDGPSHAAARERAAREEEHRDRSGVDNQGPFRLRPTDREQPRHGGPRCDERQRVACGLRVRGQRRNRHRRQGHQLERETREQEEERRVQ